MTLVAPSPLVDLIVAYGEAERELGVAIGDVEHYTPEAYAELTQKATDAFLALVRATSGTQAE